jgi:hypothetical protein
VEEVGAGGATILLAAAKRGGVYEINIIIVCKKMVNLYNNVHLFSLLLSPFHAIPGQSKCAGDKIKKAAKEEEKEEDERRDNTRFEPDLNFHQRKK